MVYMGVSSLSITIVDYDSEWPSRFQQEKDVIDALLHEIGVCIEHVGSTSVPGVAAKPIVDIMIGVTSPSHLNECVNPLQNLGYTYLPEYEATVPFRRLLIKRHPTCAHNFNIHVVEIGCDFWMDQISFRNYLRCNPMAAQDYVRLKRELAKEHRDIDGYTAAKTSFVRSILRKTNQDTK